MKRIIFFLLFGIIAGCGPNEGDVYEHLLTRKRIKIDMIGIGHELRDEYEAQNKIVEELVEDMDDMETKRAMVLTLMRFPVLSDSDSLEKCFSYEYKTDSRVGTMTMVRIESLDELEDYKKVN